jgi:formate dehydrogenase iron-sulfur subunit
MLPLLERTSSDDPRFTLTTCGAPASASSRIPGHAPEAGEQYRFHFDMAKCIGCKCCEVACNEQNNNPAEIRWRRVGEIEAGDYPFTKRFHLSIGCNHCLEPACMIGCPVEAYRRDATGIVLHDPNVCIGCQYCTWNCPYSVPQFNPERGVVGKCDLCHGRLQEGREPACVSACPQGAIQVEIVNIEQWRASAAAGANAPGMPPAETTLSTTRISAPASAAAQFRNANYFRVRPEHPHWPLIVLLVLTQMATGAFAAATVAGTMSLLALLAAFAVLAAGLTASLLHLGRPVMAWRAFKMWRRSWLSREVLTFSMCAGFAQGACVASLLGAPAARTLVSAAAIAGLLGVWSSARIYMVPARPAWNRWWTATEFLGTAVLLGPMLAGYHDAARAAALALAILQIHKLLAMAGSDELELQQTANLLTADLKWPWRFRLLFLAAVAALPLLPLAVLAELIGRYLFFVSVVPRNIAATFFGSAREAA